MMVGLPEQVLGPAEADFQPKLRGARQRQAIKRLADIEGEFRQPVVPQQGLARPLLASPPATKRAEFVRVRTIDVGTYPMFFINGN